MAMLCFNRCVLKSPDSRVGSWWQCSVSSDILLRKRLLMAIVCLSVRQSNFVWWQYSILKWWQCSVSTDLSAGRVGSANPTASDPPVQQHCYQVTDKFWLTNRTVRWNWALPSVDLEIMVPQNLKDQNFPAGAEIFKCIFYFLLLVKFDWLILLS